MSQSLKTTAYVLRRRSLPNQDIFISVFSRENGKISCIAKGVKKITSRRQPHIQTGNLLDIILREHNERFYLEDTRLVSAFSVIKADPRRMDQLYTVLFVMDRLMPENQPELQLFSRLQEFVITLSNDGAAAIPLTDFLNSMLVELGYLEQHVDDSRMRGVIEGLINEKLPLNTL